MAAGAGESGVGQLATDYDPTTGYLLIVADFGRITAFDPVSNQVVKQSGVNWSHGEGSGAYDPERKIFALINDVTPDGIFIYDLSTINWNDSSKSLPWNKKVNTYRIVGGNKVTFIPPTASHMGVQYDPDKKLFTVWDGDRSVWTLNPDTWIWTQIANANGAAPSAINPGNGQRYTAGVYGRWRYMPEYGIYLAYDNPHGNVWLYRMP